MLIVCFFLIFAQGDFDEYPQSNIRKIGIPMQTPVFFFCIKVGYKWVYFLRTCSGSWWLTHYYLTFIQDGRAGSRSSASLISVILFYISTIKLTNMMKRIWTYITHNMRTCTLMICINLLKGSSPALATCETSKFCLRVCQVVFLGVLPFSPHLMIGPSHMSWNTLERDVKLN